MSFARDLAQGQRGEQRFHAMFPSLIATNGKFEDFIMQDEHMIELKTEARTAAPSKFSSMNLALEVSSSPGRPGCIERAAVDGMAYIVFMYDDGAIFAYRPQDLLAYMTSSQDKIAPVRNSKAKVMLTPRSSVKHLVVTELFKKEAA